MIKLEKAATKIMAAIGTAVMLFLLFYSWKYTKRLVEPEYYLDEKDSILWNALVGVVLVAVCGALSGVMKKIPAWALHLLAVLGAVTAVILGICNLRQYCKPQAPHKARVRRRGATFRRQRRARCGLHRTAPH